MLKTVAEHKTNNNKGGKIRRRKSPVSLTLLEAAENYKITDFFRRSTRKPESQKKVFFIWLLLFVTSINLIIDNIAL